MPASAKIVYLVTGVNRGIGKALVTSLLLRPDTTVIGTVRDVKQAAHLQELSTTKGSSLILVQMEVTQPDSIAKAIDGLQVDKIDVVIANAGCELYDVHIGSHGVQSLRRI
jgi:norsolorinic acid ketoreductase